MKKLLVTVMASASLCTAPAQLFSSEALGGAMWGSLIGGLAGADCHDSFSGEGAAIGAGVGLLVGALAGAAQRNHEFATEPAYLSATTVSLGYGYSQGGSSAYVYYAPNAYCAPGNYYRATRANYAVSGTLLGAASGALIGAGNEQAGQGAAIGAATGLVLGSVAELAARDGQRHTPFSPGTPTQATAANADATGNADLQTPAAAMSCSEVTSKPCATSTYTWTPRPQIADAPRVPEAPTL